MADLYEYEFMWTTDLDRYVLFHTGSSYIIVEVDTQNIVRIEDPDIANEVKRLMYDAGVEIVEE